MLCPEFEVAAPETAEATLALVHIAGVLAADRLMGEVTQAARRDEPVPANERAGAAGRGAGIVGVYPWMVYRGLRHC